MDTNTLYIAAAVLLALLIFAAGVDAGKLKKPKFLRLTGFEELTILPLNSKVYFVYNGEITVGFIEKIEIENNGKNTVVYYTIGFLDSVELIRTTGHFLFNSVSDLKAGIANSH